MQIIGHLDPPRSLVDPLNWDPAHVLVATNLASYRARNVGIPAKSSREDASESRWVLIKCRGECRCTITVKAPCTRSLNTKGWLTLGVHVPATPRVPFSISILTVAARQRAAGAALAEGRLEKGALPSSPPSILHDPMQRDCSIHITDLRTWTFSAYRDKSAILHA